MNRIIKSVLSELLFAVRELAGLAVIIASFLIVALLFMREPLDLAIAGYNGGRLAPAAALFENLATPYALLTVPILALVFYLPIRFFAEDRARTFGIDTSRKNYLAAARDYASVLMVAFTACASIWPPLAGGYFIPVATLAGIILAWYAYSIIVNFGGYGEAVGDTLRDLAVVMALLLAGKVIPAVFRGVAYSSVTEYFMEIGMIYVIGAGIGIITYPGKGIVLPLSGNRLVSHLQSYTIAVFAYFAGIFIALLPVLVLLLLAVVFLLISLVFFAIMGDLHGIGDFASGLIHSMVFPRGKGLFPVAVYSPMLYVIAFFRNMAMASIGHWTGVVELVSFFMSLHYSLWKYRRRL